MTPAVGYRTPSEVAKTYAVIAAKEYDLGEEREEELESTLILS